MQPIHEQLAEIRRKVRQVLWLYGMSWLVAVGLGAVVIAGCMDWMLRLEDPGTRVLLSLTLAGLVGFILFRRLIQPLRVPLGDLDLALKIESRFPGLQDSLASTVQFLSGTDPSVGSPVLQQRVIQQTLRAVDKIDLEDVVQTRPVQRITASAVAVLVLTCMIAGFNQAEAATALKRLIFPLGNYPWPRQAQLQIVTQEFEALVANPEDPLRVSRGESLEYYVINLRSQGKLPGRLKLEFRQKTGEVTTQDLQRTTLNSNQQQFREVGLLNFVAKDSVEFRVVGGDDQQMPWYPLEVVPPPVAEELQISIQPPSYTHLPATRLPRGVGHVEAWIGSRIQVSAKASKPLKQGTLRVKDQHQFPLSLAADAQVFAGEFKLSDPGVYSYWLDLRDLQGFGNADAPRYEIRAQADNVPDISIELPATDITVTPTATVPLKFLARDDLGLREIRLAYVDPKQQSSLAPTLLPLGSAPPQAKQHSTEMGWDLTSLKLEPGAQLQFHAEATDEYDLGDPHVGRSLPRTITVISPEEKSREITQQQASVLSDLQRTLKMEDEVAAQTAELRTQLEKTGKLRPVDVDQLQRMEHQQRQIASTLADRDNGIAQRARDLLKQMADNRLPAEMLLQQLGQIANEVQLLSENNLNQIEGALTEARKLAASGQGTSPQEQDPANSAPEPSKTSPEVKPSAKKDAPTEGLKSEKPQQPGNPEPSKPSSKPNPGEPNPDLPKAAPAAENPTARYAEPPKPLRSEAGPVEKQLHQAAENQHAVTETLRDLVRQLSQWQDERAISAELAELATQQAQLNKDAAELRDKTVSKPLQELDPQQHADLARQAERQQQQAQRLDRLQNQMEEMKERLEKIDPTAAENLSDSLQRAREQRTAGLMREAARKLSRNQMGQALEDQRQILEQLQQLSGQLQEQSQPDAEMLVKNLQQADLQLFEILILLEEMLRKAEEARNNGDPKEREQALERLRKEQEELRQQVEEMARRLRKMNSTAGQEALQRAAQQMQQAGERLQRDQGEGEEAEQAQEESLDDLEQARQEVQQERELAQEKLLFEQHEKLTQAIRDLIPRQEQVVLEIERLETLRRERGSWTRAQLKSLRDLGDVEKGLQTETGTLAERLTQAPVFSLALKGAVRHLTTVVERLANRQTDTETLIPARAVLQRFKDLAEALAQKGPDGNQGGANQGQGGNQGGQGENARPPGDSIALIAELTILRTLQVELNTRSQQLAEKREKMQDLTPAEWDEIKDIAEQQGQLADLLVKFASQFAEHEAPTEMEAEDKPAEQMPEETEPAKKPDDMPDEDDPLAPPKRKPATTPKPDLPQELPE